MDGMVVMVLLLVGSPAAARGVILLGRSPRVDTPGVQRGGVVILAP